MFPLAEIDAPLPTVAPVDESTLPPFAHVLGALLDKGALPSQPLDDIALSCIAYALNRICLDAATQQAFILGAGGSWGGAGEGRDSGWAGEGRRHGEGLERRYTEDERNDRVATPVYTLPVPAYKIQ